MRFIIRVRLPIEAGNIALKDPEFGEKINRILKEINTEAAYFTSIDGQRGVYIITSFDDASIMADIAEKFHYWGNADVDFIPVMNIEDILKVKPDIDNIIEEYGG
jgi:hypothetical protein